MSNVDPAPYLNTVSNQNSRTENYWGWLSQYSVEKYTFAHYTKHTINSSRKVTMLHRKHTKLLNNISDLGTSCFSLAQSN